MSFEKRATRKHGSSQKSSLVLMAALITQSLDSLDSLDCKKNIYIDTIMFEIIYARAELTHFQRAHLFLMTHLSLIVG